MKNSQNKRLLTMVLIIVIGLLAIGIGYAAVTAVTLIVNANVTAESDQNNFKVHFIKTSNTPRIDSNVVVSGNASISEEDDKFSMCDISGLE